jgi:hypothetical protein
MRAILHRLSTRAYLAAGALALLALLAQPRSALAQQPWSTPDVSGNISNTNTGNVGIGTGTATPGAKLDLVGAASDANSGALKISNSAAASLFFVRNDGKVGVGTTNPPLQIPRRGLFHGHDAERWRRAAALKRRHDG